MEANLACVCPAIPQMSAVHRGHPRKALDQNKLYVVLQMESLLDPAIIQKVKRRLIVRRGKYLLKIGLLPV